MLSVALGVPTSVDECELTVVSLSGTRFSAMSDATQTNAAVANVFSSTVSTPRSWEADSESVTLPATSAGSTLLRNVVSVGCSAFKTLRSKHADALSLARTEVPLALESWRVE